MKNRSSIHIFFEDGKIYLELDTDKSIIELMKAKPSEIRHDQQMAFMLMQYATEKFNGFKFVEMNRPDPTRN